ncbi:MAG: elongation factor G, partial [Chloroflexota bacterium]|nr:elongation factor G [Chloroflexota bacterium]
MEEFRAEDIRNVLLLSHTGAGKTSLAESMLFNAKLTTRLGKVDDGNTVCDFEPEEIKRRSSTSTALAPMAWGKSKINVIDAPGYFDFVGEVKASLRVTDGVLIVVCAASGVEVGTELAWSYAEDMGLPRMIFVNKIDRENADFTKIVSELEEKLGRRCVPIQLAVGSQDSFQGVFDLVSMKPLGDAEADAISQDELDTFREKMVEGVADVDDDLATKYLEGEELTEAEIRSALRAGTRDGKIVPVLVGTALRDKGIAELMDAICEYMPSPKDRGEIQVHNGDTLENLAPDDNAHLSAFVFKTSTDPYVGKMSYLRVFSGVLNSDSSVWNTGKKKAEKIGQLGIMRGKTQEPASRIVAGDIGVVTKLAEVSTGDTLSSQEHPVSFDAIDFPVPNLSFSINPKTKADVDKLGTVLNKVIEEDPSLSLRRDASTGETILSGIGEAQVDVTVGKMNRKFGLDAELMIPKIPFKETITSAAKAEYKHKKQTGGHGQFGHVLIELEPVPKGGGFEFAERIVGGAIPKNYIPAVEKGITEALSSGVLAGYPMVDMKVTLYDGSFHAVDSSDMAFKIAGLQALKKGFAQAQPVLLEPIVNLRITVPETSTGDVMGDLNGRRARIS